MLYYNVTYTIAIPSMRYLMFLFLLLPAASYAEISVVTSIRPLFQITSAIMHGAGEPAILIGDEHSAHHFAFKPSHFRTLQQADLVIWIDRGFESGFQQLPDILSSNTRQLALIPTLGLTKDDGHIWYSPELLILISTEISRVLAALDPENQAIFRRNLVDFQQSVKGWRQEVRQIIAEQNQAFILDHEFLHHFEQAFDLEAFASIHDQHDQHGGIGSLQAIEDLLGENSVKCIVSNTGSVSRTARNLAEQFSLSIRPIRSFANDGEPATRFVRHLQHFTNILRDC